MGGAAGLSLRTVAISTMGTYSVISLFEGLVTGLIVVALLRIRPELVRVADHLRPA